MFIAMNRFQVKKGAEQAFENVWASRESYLGNMPGFVEFHLLKGPVADDHTLYSSHTTWLDKAAFEACLPSLLPLGTKVAHKTGTGSRGYMDGGIIWKGDRPLCILTIYTEAPSVGTAVGSSNHSKKRNTGIVRPWQCHIGPSLPGRSATMRTGNPRRKSFGRQLGSPDHIRR